MAETTASTTWGNTLTLEDLKRLERELELMPKPQWALIAPDGRTWMDTDPQALLRVLAGFVFKVEFVPLTSGVKGLGDGL